MLRDPMHPPILLPSDANMLVELGDPDTKFEDQLSFLHIEKRDVEVLPFRDWFLSVPHVIYVATDPMFGPIIVSLQRQKKDKATGVVAENSRVLVRHKGVRDVDLFSIVLMCLMYFTTFSDGRSSVCPKSDKILRAVGCFQKGDACLCWRKVFQG